MMLVPDTKHRDLMQYLQQHWLNQPIKRFSVIAIMAISDSREQQERGLGHTKSNEWDK